VIEFSVRQVTAKNRYARALAAVTDWCRTNRHRPIKDQHAHLSVMMRGCLVNHHWMQSLHADRAAREFGLPDEFGRNDCDRGGSVFFQRSIPNAKEQQELRPW
jgi:hypothetical protein